MIRGARNILRGASAHLRAPSYWWNVTDADAVGWAEPTTTTSPPGYMADPLLVPGEAAGMVEHLVEDARAAAGVSRNG